jgi:hypothetical protein
METLHHPEYRIKNRYRITHTLGRGGICITYAAEDLETGKAVTIKTLSLRATQEWKAIELFEREAKVLSQLEHSAIPDYLDYFQIDTTDDRRFYIVQELAAGQSLEEAIASGWYPTELEIRDIAKQVLEILTYLHQFSPPVVHRDIKPQNIIRQSNGRILLVDFGAVQDTYRHTMTSGSTVVGTYGYMAPEQFRGQAQPSTDLYGLGATLIYLLTHQSSNELPENRMKIDFRPYVNVSHDLADWLEQMLEPGVEDRFASAAEALAVLKGDRESIYYPQVSRDRQPAGSDIVLNKTKHKLVVEIPPRGVHLESTFCIIAAIALNGFLLMGTIAGVQGNIFTILLMSIPLGTMGLCVTGGFLYYYFVRIRLEIDREQFYLQWKCFLWSHTLEGNVEEISQVNVSRTNMEVDNQPIRTCNLQVGGQNYRFGSQLKIPEQEWLVSEVGYFVGKPTSIPSG